MADKTVRIIVRGVDEVSGVFDGIGKKIGGRGGLAGTLGTVGKVAAGAVVGGVVAAGAAVTAFGASAVKGAISYESAFAGVTKTTDGLVDSTGALTAQGEEMRKAFLDLSTVKPISPEALAGIGELGGQLGIQRENLIDFTGVIADLAVTTNLTEDAAATSFARIANVMGTPQDQFDRMGSSVVELGNNFATTEADIVAFANRIAGSGKIVGMSEADIFGISAAFSSVGVQAEAGGTAVQKALLTMNEAVMSGGENLEVFALTAGLSAEEFKQLWQKDATRAFQLFIEGLGVMGDDAAGVLDMVGLADQRLLTAFLKLSQAGDLLGRSVETSNKAWKENTALSKEAEQRYNTTESQIQLLKNTWGKLTKEIGLAFLPTLKDIVKNIREFISKHSDSFVEFFTGLGGAVSSAIPGILRFITIFLDVGKFILETLATGDSLNDWLTHIPEAIRPIVKGFADFLLLLKNIGRFILDTVITGDALNDWLTHIPEPIRPVVRALGEFIAFLRDAIPLAIQKASDFWSNTLQPALKEVWSFIQDSVIPILSDLWSFLNENLPTALQFVSDLWNDVFLPALNDAWSFIQDSVIPAIQRLADVFQEKLSPALSDVSVIFEKYLGVVLNVWNIGQEVFSGLIGFIGDLVNSVTQIDTSSETLQAFGGVWTLIKDSVGAALDVISPSLRRFAENFSKGFSKFDKLLPRFAKLWESIKPIVIGAALLIGAAIAGLLGLITGIISGIAEAIEPFLDAWINIIDGTIEIVTGFIDFITGFGELIVGILTLNPDLIKDGWRRMVEGIKQIWEGLWTTLEAMTVGSWEIITSFVSGFIDGIIEFFNNLYDALVGGSIIPDLVDRILGLFGTLRDEALGILDTLVSGAIGLGEDLISGLAGAIEGGLGTVTGAIGGLLNSAIDTAKDTLQSGSPSKVFMGFGEDIGTGLTAGMRSMMGVVQKEAQGLTSFGGLASAAPATGAMGGGGITNIQIFVEGVNVSRGSTAGAGAEDEALIMMINKIRRRLQLTQ